MSDFIKKPALLQASIKNKLDFFTYRQYDNRQNLRQIVSGDKFMAKDDVIVFTGTVEDKLPNTMFRVKLENGHEILATVCGKMRKARIWVNVGERVRVEMTPYDLDKGRITFVERNRPAPDAAATK